MFKSILILLATLAASHNTYADTFKSEEELVIFTNKVMTEMSKGNIGTALLYLKPYVILPESDFQSSLEGTKSQRELYASRLGKDVGYECFKPKKLGLSLVRQACIEKTEKGAIAWQFLFYKSPTGWNINSYSWSTDAIPSLFMLDQ